MGIGHGGSDADDFDGIVPGVVFQRKTAESLQQQTGSERKAALEQKTA